MNVLIIDAFKLRFDRIRGGGLDPNPELILGIANEVLSRLRVYSRCFNIAPLVRDNPFIIHYLTDELKQLEEEEGKYRYYAGSFAIIGRPVITPEIFGLLVPNWGGPEPYVWDQLLLDAFGQLPDVGGSIVMAYTALETFIAWALDILHQANPLPEGLWEWIKERGDDWRRTPSVYEQLDTLLTVFSGRSLKREEPTLWESFNHLKDARNAVAHEGVAAIGRKQERVDSVTAQKLVQAAEKIIAWVERLLPEAHRRIRTKAEGPFSRRLAGSEWHADASVIEGQLGELGPGERLTLAVTPAPTR